MNTFCYFLSTSFFLTLKIGWSLLEKGKTQAHDSHDTHPFFFSCLLLLLLLPNNQHYSP